MRVLLVIGIVASFLFFSGISAPPIAGEESQSTKIVPISQIDDLHLMSGVGITEPTVRTLQFSPVPNPSYSSPVHSAQCCKICRKGKACGNSCISRSYTCRKPPGCACDG
jgi:hypothetical protein